MASRNVASVALKLLAHRLLQKCWLISDSCRVYNVHTLDSFPAGDIAALALGTSGGNTH